MAKIIECVPNFSEGRDHAVIDAIASAISATEGCTLLDVDPGASTNRTVYTFVGNEKAIVEGAVNGAKAAYKLIDMRKHQGEHIRIGALDVCPFIPVQNASMDDCVGCARRFGARAAEELGVPVYMYGYASDKDYRKSVPQIRSGQYEGLQEKLRLDEWKPDYGPSDFVPTWGATIAGARKFLIAYNINVLGTKEQAHRLALNLREQGRGPDQQGCLKKVQGMGWYLNEANLAQISLNLLDYEESGMHSAFEAATREAKELNIGICGSEVVGLVPLDAMLRAADHYIQKESLFILEEEQKIRLAIERLGLSSIKVFNPKERIIEYMVGASVDGPLASLSLKKFICAIGSRSSAPGGGSASAAVASIGAGLGLMVGWMSYGNRKFEHLDGEMRKLIPQLYQGMMQLIPLIDADTNAFNDYMAAMKMPKSTKEEVEKRDRALLDGLKTAINVPLKVMETCNACWDSMVEIAKVGNETTLSDMQVGAKSLQTGVFGAHCNVMINLKNMADVDYKNEVVQKADAMLNHASEKLDTVLKVVSERM